MSPPSFTLYVLNPLDLDPVSFKKPKSSCSFSDYCQSEIMSKMHLLFMRIYVNFWLSAWQVLITQIMLLLAAEL